MSQYKDWRGTPINVGDTCIYGAPVGRSIAMVEAEVVGFTKSGRINVKPVYRAYGSYGEMKEVVHVGPDRLTIVLQLPPTNLLTEHEKAIESAKRRVGRWQEVIREGKCSYVTVEKATEYLAEAENDLNRLRSK